MATRLHGSDYTTIKGVAQSSYRRGAATRLLLFPPPYQRAAATGAPLSAHTRQTAKCFKDGAPDTPTGVSGPRGAFALHAGAGLHHWFSLQCGCMTPCSSRVLHARRGRDSQCVPQASGSSFAGGARLCVRQRALACPRIAALPVRAVLAAEEFTERLRLHNLAPQPGSRRPNKRKGRGYGAGQVREQHTPVRGVATGF